MKIELLESSIASQATDRVEGGIDDTVEHWLFSRRQDVVDEADDPFHGGARSVGAC
jgi:hypothetical protein